MGCRTDSPVHNLSLSLSHYKPAGEEQDYSSLITAGNIFGHNAINLFLAITKNNQIDIVLTSPVYVCISIK